ncbi:MAG: ATP-binding protein [Xenococcaceae cyanobacterium MO_188.B32]|nr:ATP-binding protein [Xenococcaceae cyanobacterium MO_188.B32]
MLACTRHLLKKLKDNNPDPILHWLEDRWEDLKELALTPPKVENVSVEAAVTTFAKITANLRAVPSQRAKIRELVNPHTITLLKALNEFIDTAQNKLPLGKIKLVIIADSLDRITPTIQEDGRTNHDRIFIDRSQQLKGLDCHVVYTVPISLLYSSRANDLYDNYGDTTILPMIMVQQPDGSPYQPGLDKLKEIISKRIKIINPNLNLETDIFEDKTILERLCAMSGGHVRQLMQLIQESINNIDDLPITAKAARRSITKLRDVYRRTIEESQWSILAKVAKSKKLENSDDYRNLLFNRCILEYVYLDEQSELNSWCDVHPLIKDISKFRQIYQQSQQQESSEATNN